MSTLLDLLYREYCRARLAEMRRQLLIPVSDEVLEAHRDSGDPAGRSDAGGARGEAAATSEVPAIK